MSEAGAWVYLPDGSKLDVAPDATVLSVAESIGPRLARAAVGGAVDKEPVGLTTRVPHGAEVRILTFGDEEGRRIYRHTAAHVLAHAAMQLFPGTKLGIGPALEDRFYYDMEFPKPVTTGDLQALHERMCEIIDSDLPITREEISRDDAIAMFEGLGQSYKVELVRDLPPDEVVTLYRQGDWVDLCRGPHLPSTGHLDKSGIALLSLAGAYWRGVETNPMLQRVYGTAFADAAALAEFLEQQEQARQRDHRLLGRELDLVTFFEQEAGPGMAFWQPKGALLKHHVEQWILNEHLQRGYQLVCTPHVTKVDLWKTSGHYGTYDMFLTEIDKMEYGVRPMNCPGHILLYQSKTRSYRDMPLRFFELGTVYRQERAGVLHGLLRVRGFTQDDAHIFCTPEQMAEEIIRAYEFSVDCWGKFGFTDREVFLATRPAKSVGSDEIWERATESLRQALDKAGLPYEVDEGGGAFYGPKIDVKFRDAIGRSWQGPTFQCDLNLPERFELTYIGEDGAAHRPVMLHRVVLAGIERFIGLLIEHYAGAFPLWLAPVQVAILPIADRHHEYARRVRDQLIGAGYRAEIDESGERVSYKIGAAERSRVPYMVVLGDREEAGGQVGVRKRGEGDLGAMSVEDFIGQLTCEIGE
jgi:threonyl-tRNA synthetase